MGIQRLFFLFGVPNFMQTGDEYLFEDVIDLIYTRVRYLLKDKTCSEDETSHSTW